MNTRANPSRRNSHRSRSAGSNACASTPFSRSADSTPLPDMSEISRSDDGPPINTATLPNSATMLSDNAYFLLQCDTRAHAHGFAHVCNQGLDVLRCARALGIDDEVRV